MADKVCKRLHQVLNFSPLFIPFSSYSIVIWRTVTDVKMSKDESLIYSASHDGSANIWKAANGKLVSTLRKYIASYNKGRREKRTNKMN